MKNIGAERQLSEYNHVYKENTAIYRDLSVRMGMDGKHLLDSVYPARGRSARHAERHVRHFRLSQADGQFCAQKAGTGRAAHAFGRARARRQAIRLTETGMKLAEQTVDFVIEAEQRALLDLSSEEQAQLLTLMRRYNDALTFHFSAIDKENTHE